MSSRYIVAIEIGSSKIKGAVGFVDPTTGSLSVQAIEEEKISPNYVRYGCVQNVGEVANELNRIILKLNNRIRPRKIKSVYLGVGGRSVMGTHRRFDYTLPEEMEVTNEIVDELMARAEALPGGDREVVEVDPGEFLVDGMAMTNPVGAIGRNISASMCIVSCRSQILRNLSLAVTDKLQLGVNGYVVRQLAVADLVLTPEERRLGCMLVDCGAETTTVSIYKGGVLRHLVTIPLGSRHITRDVASLNYLEERAEELKKNVGNVNPNNSDASFYQMEGIDTETVNNYVRARATEIALNVNAQIAAAGLAPTDLPAGIITVGGGASLSGFSELLDNITTLPVRKGTPPASVKLAGSTIRTAEDVDIIALLYKVSLSAPRSCVENPEPKPEPGPLPMPDDDEPDKDTPSLDKPNRGNWWERLKNSLMGTDGEEDDKLD